MGLAAAASAAAAARERKGLYTYVGRGRKSQPLRRRVAAIAAAGVGVPLRSGWDDRGSERRPALPGGSAFVFPASDRFVEIPPMGSRGVRAVSACCIDADGAAAAEGLALDFLCGGGAAGDG